MISKVPGWRPYPLSEVLWRSMRSLGRVEAGRRREAWCREHEAKPNHLLFVRSSFSTPDAVSICDPWPGARPWSDEDFGGLGHHEEPDVEARARAGSF